MQLKDYHLFTNLDTITKLPIQFLQSEFMQQQFDEIYLPSNQHQNFNKPTIILDCNRDQQSVKATQEIQKPKKSIYHNFQKHLVTTLKRKIKIYELYRKTDQNQLAIKIWDKFLKSHAKTRQILWIIFGQFNNNQTTIKKFIQYGYEQIIENYSENQIRKAQTTIRLLTADELNKLTLSEILNNRKIKNIQNFQLYIRCFCKQLYLSPLKQRLNKNSSNQVNKVKQINRSFCEVFYQKSK